MIDWKKLMHKIIYRYLYFEFLFEKKFGWFFTNGRKNFNTDVKVNCLKNKAIRYCQLHSLVVLTFFISIIGFAVPTKINAQKSCNWQEVKKEKLKSITPFKYYTFKVTDLYQNNSILFKTFEVPIYANGEYNFLFEPKIVDHNLKVQIFDVSSENTNAHVPIFESHLHNEITGFNFVNPGNYRRLKIVYTKDIDSKQNEQTSNCVLFYSGYIMEEVEGIEKLERLSELVAY